MRRGSPNRNFTAFMAGRYGADALGRFLSVCGCICILLSVAVRGKSAFFSAVFSAAALALLIWCYVRIFSRKVAARSEENPEVSFVPEPLFRLVPAAQKLLPPEKGLCFLPLPELQGGRARPARQGKDPHHLPALRVRL